MRVKSRGFSIKKVEFNLNYIIVVVSDFSLQKFNLSIFVTEGLLRNSIPLGQPLLGAKVEFTPTCTVVGGEAELMEFF